MEHGRASLLSTLMTQEFLLLLLVPSLLAAFLTLGFAMQLHQSKTTLSQKLEETHRYQRAQAETIAALQAANETLRAELEEAHRHQRAQAETIAALQAETKALRAETEALQAANEALQKALRAKLEEAQRHPHEPTKQVELEETHRYQRAQAETIAALQTANETLRAANEALQAELEKAHRHQRAQAETIAALQTANETLQAANEALRAELEELTKTITALTHDQPPSITLAESEERFRFPLGSAELSPTFRESLSKDVVPQILRAKHKYRINTVQVIGHTDEVPLSNLSSTLDKNLISFISTNAAIAPGSNTDLAMLRAVAVLKVLRAHPELKDLNLVPYSAGQVLLPGDLLASGQEKGQNPGRRRVVIRLTRF